MVLGMKKVSTPRMDESLEDESEGRGSFTPTFESKAPEVTVEEPTIPSPTEDEDDALSYFQKLAES